MTEALWEDPNGERLLTASGIAEYAGVQPSAVSNWRKRFPNFPRPVGQASSGGDLFRESDVAAWLSERDRMPKQARGAADQLWASAERLRGKSVVGDLVATLATCAILVHLARKRGEVPPSGFRGSADQIAPWMQITTARLSEENPQLADFFSPLRSLDSNDLRLLLDSADEFESSEDLAAAMDDVIDPRRVTASSARLARSLN